MATINDILSVANKLVDENKFREAIEPYMLLINEGFEKEEVFYNLAICQGEVGNYEEAFIASNLFLKLNPNVQEMLHFRAVASWRLNNFEAADLDFQKAIELGDTAAEINYKDFTKAQVLNGMDHFTMSYENDKVSVDLSNVFFISNQHKRFENEIQVSHSLNCDRAIRIIQNINDNTIFEVKIYSLQKPHPVWKSYLTMAPKQMKITETSRISTKMDGFGVDNFGEPFYNYSLTINHDLTTIENMILHLNDRKINVLYENL